MNCSNKAGSVFASLLLGGIIGGTLGILFAPAKGRETRKKLSRMPDEAEAMTDSLKEKFNSLMEQIKKDVETAKDRVKDFA